MPTVVKLEDLSRGSSWQPDGDLTTLLLGEDEESARHFWAAMLWVADRDKAQSIHFHSWLEYGLSYVADGVYYTMTPPPPGLTPALLVAARRLLVPRRSPFRLALAWASGVAAGRFIFESGGQRSEWRGVCWRAGSGAGVELYRMPINVVSPRP